MSAVTYPHIEIDNEGVARFSGSRFKIIHVIVEHTEWKWSPEAIHEQHPDLSLSQIHSALAYYYDHQQEIDAEIEQRDTAIERLRQQTEDRQLQERLRQSHPSGTPSP